MLNKVFLTILKELINDQEKNILEFLKRENNYFEDLDPYLTRSSMNIIFVTNKLIEVSTKIKKKDYRKIIKLFKKIHYFLNIIYDREYPLEIRENNKLNFSFNINKIFEIFISELNSVYMLL